MSSTLRSNNIIGRLECGKRVPSRFVHLHYFCEVQWITLQLFRHSSAKSLERSNRSFIKVPLHSHILSGLQPTAAITNTIIGLIQHAMLPTDIIPIPRIKRKYHKKHIRISTVLVPKNFKASHCPGCMIIIVLPTGIQRWTEAESVALPN